MQFEKGTDPCTRQRSAYQKICVKMSGFSMVFWSQLHTLGNWIVINQRYTIGMRVVLKLAYHSWKHGNHILHDCPSQVSQESRGKDTHPTLSHTYTHSPSVSWLLEELTLTHLCIWLPHLASREMAPCAVARFWNIKAGTYCRLLFQESPEKREARRVKLHPCNGTHLKVLLWRYELWRTARTSGSS